MEIFMGATTGCRPIYRSVTRVTKYRSHKMLRKCFLFFTSSIIATTHMPPKRKRVTDNSDDDQRDAKRLKTGPVIALPSLHSLPDDCLVEILEHLSPLSVCSSLLVSKRLNSLFEALVGKDLSSRFGSTNKNAFKISAVVKKELTNILYPRAQYTALNQLHSTNPEILEKQLGWLQSWFALKSTELQNVRKLKTKSPELWGHLHGRFAYKEHSPATAFVTNEGSDSQVEGGTYHVSFILFGQSGHFAEIICDVLSYHQLEEYHYACKLSMNAKLLSCDSTASTEVSDLLKGYKDSNVPLLDGEESLYDYESDEQSEQFQEELDEGNRVSCKWFQTCLPKLNQKKLNQVIEWLGWTVSGLEMAQILVGLSQTPQSVKFTSRYDKEPYNEETDGKSSDTVAAFNQLPSLALIEDNEQSISRLEQTLGLLEAKIKLQNRIRREWKDKDSAKLNQLMTLVDRSMYTKWTKTTCAFSRYSDNHDPNHKFSVREVNGEFKLVTEDSSKWLSFKFFTHLEVHDTDVYEDSYKYSTATHAQKYPNRIINDDPLKLRKEDFELFKSVLGLDNFSNEELNELIKLVADLTEAPPTE